MRNNFQGDTNAAERENQFRGKKRSGGIGVVLVVFGFLVVLTLLVFLGGIAYVWITDEKPGENKVTVTTKDDLLWQSRTDTDVNTDTEPDADKDTETYTREEVEAKVAEAAALARKEGAEEILNGIKETLGEGDTTMVEMLRPYYEDELVVVSNGKFHFVPRLPELKKNNYVQENVQILENGEYQYTQDGKVTSHKGIDVSKFQGDIDWEAVAADGVEFAFIRVGNRGYGSAGTMVADNKFEKNIRGAIQAGIKVGVYFYTQAVNEEEVLEEAKFVLEKIAPYKIQCPVVYDVEKVSGADGRMNALSVEERTNLTLLFCKTIEEAGYQPMIYFNMEMAALMLDLESLEGYDKWLAYYNPELYYPYDYKIWQYSHNGRVNGIEGEVDMNICFEPVWE